MEKPVTLETDYDSKMDDVNKVKQDLILEQTKTTLSCENDNEVSDVEQMETSQVKFNVKIDRESDTEDAVLTTNTEVQNTDTPEGIRDNILESLLNEMEKDYGNTMDDINSVKQDLILEQTKTTLSCENDNEVSDTEQMETSQVEFNVKVEPKSDPEDAVLTSDTEVQKTKTQEGVRDNILESILNEMDKPVTLETDYDNTMDDVNKVKQDLVLEQKKPNLNFKNYNKLSDTEPMESSQDELNVKIEPESDSEDAVLTTDTEVQNTETKEGVRDNISDSLLNAKEKPVMSEKGPSSIMNDVIKVKQNLVLERTKPNLNFKNDNKVSDTEQMESSQDELNIKVEPESDPEDAVLTSYTAVQKTKTQEGVRDNILESLLNAKEKPVTLEKGHSSTMDVNKVKQDLVLERTKPNLNFKNNSKLPDTEQMECSQDELNVKVEPESDPEDAVLTSYTEVQKTKTQEGVRDKILESLLNAKEKPVSLEKGHSSTMDVIIKVKQDLILERAKPTLNFKNDNKVSDTEQMECSQDELNVKIEPESDPEDAVLTSDTEVHNTDTQEEMMRGYGLNMDLGCNYEETLYKDTEHGIFGKHIEALYEQVKYPNPGCSYEGTTNLDVNTNIAVVQGKVKYPCPECGHTASRKDDLRRHIEAVHQEIRYPCPFCNHAASRKGDLKRHIQAVHEKVRYPCPKCSHMASQKRNLKKHIEAVHDEVKYPCPNCSHIASRKGDLKRHIEAVHEKVKYPCPECSYKATRKEDVKRHIESVHEKVRYPCPQCNHLASRKEDLKHHIEVVHEQVKYPCPLCSHMATQKGKLKRHIKTVHEDVKYPCTKCSYKASRKEHLKQHIESVHVEVKYPCDLCSYVALQKANLKQHMKAVHLEVKFLCPKCDHIASQRQNLRRHIRAVHDKVKYPCSTCAYQATRKEDLKRHIETVHEKSKYSCPKCSHMASQEEDLKLHIQDVHQNFQCDDCTFKCIDRDSLISHINSVH